MEKKLKDEDKKWLVWDYQNEYPFAYTTKKEAVKDMQIFNKENLEQFDYCREYFLFKRIK